MVRVLRRRVADRRSVGDAVSATDCDAREREIANLDRARDALGLRWRGPSVIEEARALAEYLAVAEGPVPIVDLVADVFDGDCWAYGRACATLRHAGHLRSVDAEIDELTPAGRAALGLAPIIGSAA